VIAALAWICALVAVAGLCVQMANLRHFPSLRPKTLHEASIVACVAMRDEAENAPACIDALLEQREIVAVVACDDGSRDETRALLEAIAARDARVRLAHLAPGSGGSKSAALAAAAAAARTVDHRYLLFTDADVRFEAGAAGALLERLRGEGVQAVAAWPRVRCEGFGDLLLAPMVTLFLLQALPMWRSRSGDPRFAAGNGQAFLVERAAYEACGGHARIDATVEDVALARNLVRGGSAVAFASAARIAYVRGYGSVRGGVEGLGRSLFAAAGLRGCAAFAAWQVAAFAAPFAFVTAVPAAAACGIGAAVAARILLAARMRQGALAVALAPFAATVAGLGALWTAIGAKRGALVWRRRSVLA
jgi:GT2 family glycosyltransferase